ncbi:MAG: hypothetical protein R3217_07015 [Gammaproteobacteria bacterium]|nr:hypothetical protein [Gammaproteobacteria bacterium]
MSQATRSSFRVQVPLILLALLLAGCASEPPRDPLDIGFGPLTSAEQKFLDDGAYKRPPVISIIRSLPESMQRISSERLAWKSGPRGWAARIRVTSPGASALTLAICAETTDVPVALNFEQLGSEPIASLAEVEEKCADVGQAWLPRVDGSTATLRFSADSKLPPADFDIRLVEIRHRN